ncbi:hypothetical protein GQX74_006114 [Glossina fuscipes]|nr:hypothetical protein GQX74_006114 [Glossina fuscipes]
MLCDLYPYTGTDFTDLTQHFKAQHPGMESYIKCCTRKLNCPSDIIQHVQQHEDPNCFMCEKCGRTFSNKSGLKDHHLQYHEPEKNLNFAYDICPRKFARHNLLQHHKSKHVPNFQRFFFCNTCEPPKAFAIYTIYILQIHINSCHRKAPNVCHVCAKAIRSNQSFEKHVRSHFEDSGPRIKCPREDCDSSLKDDENLKQHLRRFKVLNVPNVDVFVKANTV